jgi:ABC-type lipoprotein release transport system permease subunit
MIFIKIAWKNLWRNKRRTLLACLAIAIGTPGVIFLLSMYDYIHEKLIQGSVSSHVSYIQIHRQGYFKNEHVDSYLDNFQELRSLVKRIPHVTAVSSRIQASALIATDNTSLVCLIVGVVPEDERQITFIYRSVQSGAYLSSNSDETQKEILIGKDLANSLEVKVGEDVTVLLQGYTGTLEACRLSVKGIFDAGSPKLNRNMVFTHFSLLQKILGYRKGQISELAIQIDRDDYVDHVAQMLKERVQVLNLDIYTPLPKRVEYTYTPIDEFDQAPTQIPEAVHLQKGFEVLTWKEILPGVLQFVELDNTVMDMIMCLFFFVVAFMIFNIMLMTVFERVREFGIMRALGTSPNNIFLLVVIESALLALLSVFIGEVIALGICGLLVCYPLDLSGYKQALQIGLLDPKISVQINFANFFYPALFAGMVTVLFSIIPAWKATKLKIIEAIYHS